MKNWETYMAIYKHTAASLLADWSCRAICSYNVIHTVTGGETTNSAGIGLEKMVKQSQDFKNGSVMRV